MPSHRQVCTFVLPASVSHLNLGHLHPIPSNRFVPAESEVPVPFQQQCCSFVVILVVEVHMGASHRICSECGSRGASARLYSLVGHLLEPVLDTCPAYCLSFNISN